MKIVLCCSMKYRELVRETMKNLTDIGSTPMFPNLDYSTENKGDINSPEEKKRLALEHYMALDEADKVYFLTPEGYMGTSLKLELGYAIAKGKPVYFSEPTHDVGLDCYVQEYISTDNLKRFFEV